MLEFNKHKKFPQRVLEYLEKFLEKHADRPGNDAGTTPMELANAIMSDPEFSPITSMNMNKEEVSHAVMDYQDRIAGY